MYNFVYINTHDTGRFISPYGFYVNTNELMKLASDGVLFTHAYCCGPTCSPSRSAMLTGQYPHQNGMLGLAQRGFTLSNPKYHLANYLKSNGYITAISGIQHEVGWYLDIDDEKLHGIGYEEILSEPSNEYKKEELHLWDKKNAENIADWLDKLDTSKPFMLSYGLHSTHRPYPVNIASNIDERYVKPSDLLESNAITRHDHALYLTTAQYADENIKIVIDALKDKGLYDNTIIMYTTDHGLALPMHKCNLFDSGIGVGLIIRHPDKDKGVVIDSLISQIDVFPTICDLLDIEKPNYLEGVSFTEVFEDRNVKPREAVFAQINFHTSYEPSRCIRTNRYKYIKNYDLEWLKLNPSNIDESSVKDYLMGNGLNEYVKYSEALYDCVLDPNEKNNIINSIENKEVIEKLKDELLKQQIKTDDPILLGHIEIKKEYKVNLRNCMKASSKNIDDYDKRGTV